MISSEEMKTKIVRHFRRRVGSVPVTAVFIVGIFVWATLRRNDNIGNRRRQEDITGDQALEVAQGSHERPLLRMTPHDVIELDEDMSDEDMQREFYRYLETKDVECLEVVRLGNQADGGWNMCLSPSFAPTQPCLVYSFGINNDWSFDDAMSHDYGCTVRSFDPSMNHSGNLHNERVWFYKTGLSGRNFVNHLKWSMKTFATILAELEDEREVIDYLKMDIESSEWDALTNMIKEGSLKNVKQLGLELHFNMKKNSYIEYWKMLRSLEEEGFMKWDIEHNTYRLYEGESNSYKRFCCSNLWLINSKFIDFKRDVQPLSTVINGNNNTFESEIIDDLESMSLPEAEDSFYRYLNQKTVKCHHSLLQGHADLQDWDLCDTHAFSIKAPCLVYLFETYAMSHFLGAVQRHLQCDFLKMTYNDRTRGGGIMRLPVYQYGHGWTLKGIKRYEVKNGFNLSVFMNAHQHKNRIIDVLRIDVLEDICELLPLLTENNDFLKVKQLIIRIYLPERRGVQSSVEDYIRIQSILEQLNNADFAKWKTHPCKFSNFLSKVSGIWRSWCYELLFINMRYKRTSTSGNNKE